LQIEILEAIEWQAPIFLWRASKKGAGMSVVPHFRKWLYHACWEDKQLDGQRRPEPPPPEEPKCQRIIPDKSGIALLDKICGLTEAYHQSCGNPKGETPAMHYRGCKEFVPK